MSPPRILVDSNILVSGLVFKGGNEARILRLAVAGDIRLVLPEFVVLETNRVLRDKFMGIQHLLDAFLLTFEYEFVSLDVTDDLIDMCDVVRDVNDRQVLASVIAVAPDYIVTGDRVLREDLNKYLGSQKALLSSKLLHMLGVHSE